LYHVWLTLSVQLIGSTESANEQPRDRTYK